MGNPQFGVKKRPSAPIAISEAKLDTPLLRRWYRNQRARFGHQLRTVNGDKRKSSHPCELSFAANPLPGPCRSFTVGVNRTTSYVAFSIITMCQRVLLRGDA